MDEFDVVDVLDARRDYPARTVAVTGAVHAPNALPFLEGETLRDLIDRAGGFSEGAQLVDLSRRRVGAAFSDTTSVVTTYLAAVDFGPNGKAAGVVIEPFDRVDVRLSPGYRPQRFVRLSGDFLNPGTYAIVENVERVADLVRRAGGVLPHAYDQSFQLRRSDRLVAVEFDRAMRGDLSHNVLVRDGDELFIAPNSGVVRVEGGVQRPSLIRYEAGMSVSDYIERAGGPLERAEMHKAVVDYPSGFSRRVKRHLWMFTSEPDVVSGATITVPVAPEGEPTNVGEILTRTFQITSSIATLVIAYVAATR